MKQLQQQKYYTQKGWERQQLMLPIETEIRIAEDDPVRLASAEPNYSELYRAYSPKERKYAANPRIIFKVMVYGYMNGICSSRKKDKVLKALPARGIDELPTLEALEKLPEKDAKGIGFVYGKGKRKTPEQRTWNRDFCKLNSLGDRLWNVPWGCVSKTASRSFYKYCLMLSDHISGSCFVQKPGAPQNHFETLPFCDKIPNLSTPTILRMGVLHGRIARNEALKCASSSIDTTQHGNPPKSACT